MSRTSPSPETSGPATLPPPDEGWGNTAWSILGALMFGAMLAAAGVWTAPALVSDWRIRDAARPVGDARVEGTCNSQLFFHICDAKLSFGTGAGRVTREVNYVFTGVRTGDHAVTVMADPARPELATTDMALARLWNRTITLLVGAALLSSFVLAPFVKLLGRRSGAAGG